MLNLMPEISFNILDLINTLGIFAFGLVALTALIFYFKERAKYHQLLENQTPPASLKEAQDKGFGILRKAYKQAETILGKAELEGVKVIADSKAETKQLEEKYSAQLSKTTDQLGKDLTLELTKAQKEYSEFLEDLRSRAEQNQLLNQEFTKQKTNDLFEKFEQNLADFLTQTEQRSVTAIELEMRAAKQLIDTYKTQQLALIDENIIAMLEKTLSLVLAKKLSLKDQMDLVYEALEKAKVEKLIA